MTMANPTTSIDLRHLPVRERGVVRFNLILQSARELLLLRGLEGFSVEDVAERAEIPVGSVYQYFPNKFAIVVQLSAQDTESLAADLASFTERFPAPDWQRQTDEVIDHIAERWAAEPSRSAVSIAMKSTSATRARAAEHSQLLTLRVARLLEALIPEVGATRRLVVADVIVEMCQSLLHFSVHDGRPHPQAVVELKRMLRAYLRAVALDS